MSHQIQTLAVGERFRVGLHADVDAESPRVIGDPATGAYTYLVDSRTIDVDPGPDGLAVETAFEHFDEHTASTGQRDPAAAGHVIRWARLFHDVTVFDDGRTLWWVDPTWMSEAYPDAVRGTDEYRALEAEVVKADQVEYGKWAGGNVYGLTIEKLTTWVQLDDNGTPIPSTARDEWVVIDSLWGIYFDEAFPSDDEALRYAAENMDAPEFLDAFSALNQTSQEASA